MKSEKLRSVDRRMLDRRLALETKLSPTLPIALSSLSAAPARVFAVVRLKASKSRRRADCIASGTAGFICSFEVYPLKTFSQNTVRSSFAEFGALLSDDLRYLRLSRSKPSASALSASRSFHVKKSICGSLFLLCVTSFSSSYS